MAEGSYWDKVLRGRLSRRRALAATGGLAAGAAVLSACGGGGDKGGDGQASKPKEILDNTKGIQGGKLIWQSYGDPGGGLEMITARNPGVSGNMGGLVFDGLLEFAYGQPKYPGIGTEVLPILATSLPEISPDKLKVVFKIKQGVTFHNGQPLTSADVKWTFDTLAFDSASAWKPDYAFMDKTEAPDATTFVVYTKYPYADVMQSMTYKNAGAILNRQHQESGAAKTSMMGSGPFLFVSYEPPNITRYKRNPNYHMKPFPYFEEIERLGTTDPEKQVADFISKAVHITYWKPPEERNRIKQARPDAQAFEYFRAGSPQVYVRNDKPPFNDARVRRALSMGYDRKQSLNTVNAGEGEVDQVLSIASPFGFRKPKDLPAAKYFEYNVQEAKAMLSAAGVQLPIKIDGLRTWNATVIGQKHVDEIVLITTMWRNNGLADVRLQEETFGQFAPTFTGNYDLAIWGPNVTSTLPDFGFQLRQKYWSPPEGVKAPTLNIGYVNIPELSTLIDRQLGEFDVNQRKQTFRRVEEILSDEMVSISGVLGTLTYFIDPTVKNAQYPRDAYNGATPWKKYWWFDKA